MVFGYRAAIVAFATFVSAVAGFGLQWLLPAAYVADSKGMIGSVVGLVAALLSIVLGLLIWTSHGLFAEQQSQMLTVAAALVRFDFALKAFGSEAAAGRALLREHAQRTLQRFWNHARDGRFAHTDLDRDVEAMRRFFAMLHPSNDDQRQQFVTATEHYGKMVETQRAMAVRTRRPSPGSLVKTRMRVDRPEARNVMSRSEGLAVGSRLPAWASTQASAPPPFRSG